METVRGNIRGDNCHMRPSRPWERSACRSLKIFCIYKQCACFVWSSEWMTLDQHMTSVKRYAHVTVMWATETITGHLPPPTSALKNHHCGHLPGSWWGFTVTVLACRVGVEFLRPELAWGFRQCFILPILTLGGPWYICNSPPRPKKRYRLRTDNLALGEL